MNLHNFPSEPLDLIWFERAIAEWSRQRPDKGTSVDRFLFLPGTDQAWILERARALKSLSSMPSARVLEQSGSLTRQTEELRQ